MADAFLILAAQSHCRGVPIIMTKDRQSCNVDLIRAENVPRLMKND